MSVPNTVLILTGRPKNGKELGDRAWGFLAQGTEKYKKDMKARGYFVIEHPRVKLSEFAKLVSNPNLYGLFLAGHGAAGGMTIDGDNPAEGDLGIDSSNVVNNVNHELAFITLYMCNGIDSESNWGDAVSTKGVLRGEDDLLFPSISDWDDVDIVEHDQD